MGTLSTRSTRGIAPIIWFALALVILLWLLLANVRPAQAGGVVGSGTPQSCTSQALADAVSTGGIVTFNCGAVPATIVITQSGGIAVNGQSVTVDGGNKITLSGNDLQRVFLLSSGNLTLTNLIIMHGHPSADDGGCVLDVSTGALTLNNVTAQICSVGAGYRGGAIESFFGGVTLVNSRVMSGNAYYGGGIYKADGTLALINSQVISNSASNGGGIYALAAVSLINTDIVSNIAMTNGGGIDLEGGTALIEGSRIYSNTAQTNNGGGINIVSPARVTLNNTTLSGNSIVNSYKQGGGIFNQGVLTATASVLSGNKANPGGGGGLSNFGAATLSTVTLSHNSALSGGGIYNFYGGTLTLNNSTFSGNSGGDGGGISNEGGQATVRNSTFSGNSATLAGGGILNSSMLTVNNSTFSGNSAEAGGGISNSGAATVSNATLSGNSASSGGGIAAIVPYTITLMSTIVANSPSGGNCENNSAIASLGYNLSSDASCITYFNKPSYLNDRNNTDPLLSPLANHGGPTQTYIPNPPSQAIDAIPFGTNGCGITLIADQRGAPRPINGKCEIGAVEYGWLYAHLWLPLIVR